MVVLCRVKDGKLGGASDFGNWLGSIKVEDLVSKIQKYCLGGMLLIRRSGKYLGAVLRAHIAALSITGRGVVVGEKYL